MLVVGGQNRGTLFASAELYDPARGTWTATGSLNIGREGHTATLLPNGKVLVVGGAGFGRGYARPLSSAELYDPASGSWTTTGSMINARLGHTATLLPNGKVLVASGDGGGAELYDPATGRWTSTGWLNTERYGHTATLLPNGKVLVAGGWTMLAARSRLFPAPSCTIRPVGAWTTINSLNTARWIHTATLLPNGKVLVAGGTNSSSGLPASAELYDRASGTWSTTSALNTGRYGHTATLLANGKVLVAAGAGAPAPLASAELYDSDQRDMDGDRLIEERPRLAHSDVAAQWQGADCGGLWQQLSGQCGAVRSGQRGVDDDRLAERRTLLSHGDAAAEWQGAGRRRLAGGSSLSSAELVRSGQRDLDSDRQRSTPRATWHTATLLPNGKVLVAGGIEAAAVSASAELYDPASGTWTTTGSLNAARDYHTATLLANGKVLVAGGSEASSSQVSAELYDPASGTWTTTGSLHNARYYHTATLLPNGKVLVAGGTNTSSGYLDSAELYDPASGYLEHDRLAATPRAYSPQRRCCPTARCWSRAATTAASSCPARSCTIRPPGRGRRPAR